MSKRRFIPVLLALTLIGLILPAAAQTPTPVATPLVGTPVPTFIFPTATPAFCATPLAITAGTRIDTRPGINIRSEPRLSSAIVIYYDSSITLRATGGPVCNDGVNWWQISGPGRIAGWVAESFNNMTLIFPQIDPGLTCPTPLNLAVGTRVPLSSGGVRVRAEPNRSGLVLTVALVNTEVTILGASVCAEALNWWPVELISVGVLYQGWIAEGDESGSWLVQPGLTSTAAGTLCAPPLPLSIGTRAYVNYTDFTPKNLRTAPGTESPLLYTLIDGIGFTVLGGPACANNMNWWYIQVISRPDVVGWLSEGGPGNYWIRRIRARQLR